MQLSTPIGLRMALAALVVAGLLPPASAAAQETAAPPQVAPSITGPYTGCGVGWVDEGGDVITFGGSVTPGSTIDQAVIKQYTAGKGVAAPDRTFDSSRVLVAADGKLSGSIALQALSSATDSVSLELHASNAGVAGQGESLPLHVDPTPPTVTSAQTIASDTIKVVFSEPVTIANGDSVLEWFIRGDESMKPTSISADGVSRILRFSSTEFGEDERVQLNYRSYAGRTPYRDCVQKNLDANGHLQTTIDRIAPQIPSIIEIAGKPAGGQVSGRADAFDVKIGALTEGHSAELWLESGSVGGFDSATDRRIGAPVVAGADGIVTIGVPSLGSDGFYTFYARALDTPHDNYSGTRAAGYHLDRLAPIAKSANSDNQTVTVTFDDPLVGTDDPANWEIKLPGAPAGVHPSDVTGTGNIRRLRSANVPNGATVAYTKPASGGYTDEAGNALESFGPISIQGLIPTVLDLEPEQGDEAVADSHTVTATVKDDFGTLVPGARVLLRATSGPTSSRDADGKPSTPNGIIGECLTQADGTCTFNYTSNEVGRDLLQAWIGSSDSPPLTSEDASGTDQKGQDEAINDWTVKDAKFRVDAEPEFANGPANQPHIVSVRVTKVGGAASGLPIGGINVDGIVIEGPNKDKPVGECWSGADGYCTISYNSTVTGNDRIQFWIDSDGDNSRSGELFQLGNESATADSGVAKPVQDDPAQDVVQKNWVGVSVPALQAEPEVSTGLVGATRTLRFSTLDQAGAAIAGLNVDARVISGPNAGLYLGDCNTDSSGTCSLQYTSRVKGTDLIQSWIDADGDDLPAEATQFEARSETSAADEKDQDVIEATWTVSPATRSLDASPESASRKLNELHPLTMRVVDGNGAVVASANVDARVLSGPGSTRDVDSNPATPNGYVGQCNTSTSGTCTITLSSPVKGTDVIVAWIDADSNGTSNEVTALEPRAESSATDAPEHDVVEVGWATEDEAQGTRNLTMQASSAAVGLRAPTTLSGVLDTSSSCSAATVSILRRKAGKEFSAWRSVETGQTGEWSISFRPFHTATYRATVAALDTCDAANSNEVTVAVGSKVIAKLATSWVDVGDCSVIRGRVAPIKSGQMVQLQKRVAVGSWKTLSSSATSKRSFYRFAVCPKSAGSHRFRVGWSGDQRNGASVSSVLVLRAYR